MHGKVRPGESEGEDTGSGRSPIPDGFFRALVENRNGIILLIGRGGRINYATPSIRGICGMASGDLVGASLWEILHPEDREDLTRKMSDTDSGDMAWSFRLRSESGGWRVIRGSVQNLLEDPGVSGIVLVGREASFHEIAREEYDERFHTTFDEAPIGIARVSPDGKWTRVNRKLCEILGYERDELLGRPFREITHSDDLILDMTTMEDLLSGAEISASLEKRFLKRDYSTVWVSISATLIRSDDDEPMYFACVIQDITREREARRISDSMNEREFEILGMLAHGMTNQQIATRLNLSLSSAKVYVRRVVEKLDATDRTHAAVKAARLGLLPESEN